MKMRALGTGHLTSRHPVTTSSFLLQSDAATVVFGCGASIPARLESYNIKLSDVDIWCPLHIGADQTAGLEEIAHLVLTGQIPKVPYLAAPDLLAATLHERLAARFGGKNPLQVKPTHKITIEDEHQSEVVRFIPNFGTTPGFGLLLEEGAIFISGDTELSEDWLHAHAVDVKLVLHACRGGPDSGLAGQNPTIGQLQNLPVYLQKKIWLYGHEKHPTELDVPLPMMHLPQNWFYDSSRKQKHLEKERFIRESSKRQIGAL